MYLAKSIFLFFSSSTAALGGSSASSPCPIRRSGSSRARSPSRLLEVKRACNALRVRCRRILLTNLSVSLSAGR